MLQRAEAAAAAARTRYPRMILAHPLVVLFTLTLSPEPSLLPSSSPPSGVGVGSGSGAGVGTGAGAGVGAGTGADVGAGVTVPSSPQGPASFATQGSDVGNGGTA